MIHFCSKQKLENDPEDFYLFLRLWIEWARLLFEIIPFSLFLKQTNIYRPDRWVFFFFHINAEILTTFLILRPCAWLSSRQNRLEISLEGLTMQDYKRWIDGNTSTVRRGLPAKLNKLFLWDKKKKDILDNKYMMSFFLLNYQPFSKKNKNKSNITHWTFSNMQTNSVGPLSSSSRTILHGLCVL